MRNVLPTDTTHWKKIASKGDQGIQGPMGITGTKILYKGVYSPSIYYYNSDTQTDYVSYSHEGGPKQLYIRTGEA